MTDRLNAFASLVSAANAADPSIWLTVALPLGIATLGLAGTISITQIQLRARRRELQDDRAERAAIAVDQRAERERDSRANAIEDIVSEIAAHAAALNESIRAHEEANTNPDRPVRFPSNFKVRRALSRLTTRARERRLTDASFEMLRWASHLTLAEQPFIYGVLQERLELWFTGERTIELTIERMATDAELFKAGKLPPTSDPLF